MRTNEVEHLEDTGAFSRLIRGIAIELSSRKQAPHLGSVLSCADVLAVVASHARASGESRIETVLSKGHAALGLYAALFLDGIISEELLLSYTEAGSVLEEHPNHDVPGVQFPTGSLGHGLSLMTGRLLGAQILGEARNGVVILSDGECNEGTIWEAALFASANRVRGLVAIVDANGFQATGPTSESYGSVLLEEAFRGFGWSGEEVDGHDHNALKSAVARGLDHEAPYFIIAHTVKGRGVSFMEGDNNWHYRIPSEIEVTQSLQQLGIRLN
jgi:transketolase